MFREKIPGNLAVTFDDVILLPGKSEVEPNEVDVSTYVSREVRAEIPVVSSPMDTVTEVDMAIGLARLGGVGVLHRNAPVDVQVEWARRVKETPVYPILPVFATNDREALATLHATGLDSVPVVDERGRYLGVMTRSRALRGEAPLKIEPQPITKPFDEIVRFARSEGVDAVPVVDRMGKLLGVVPVVEVLVEGFKPAVKDGRLVVGAATSPFDAERMSKLDKLVDLIVVDVAHAHNSNVIQAVRRISKELTSDLVVGNIGTYEAAVDYITSVEKIDGFRVGIASGSICTTGVVTGVASPTLYAVAQVADALRDYGLDLPIIADGGVRSGGDAVKAFAMGAWSVMLGRVLAGAAESSGQLIRIGGRAYKYYRGMASLGARERRFSIDRYKVKDVEEGVEGLVPYEGPLKSIIKRFVGEVKAALGYVGARSIREAAKAKIILISPAGRGEIRPSVIEQLWKLGVW